MSVISPGNYEKLLVKVKQRICASYCAALKTVDKELIALHWDIGEAIAIRQQGDWSNSVVTNLSQDLQAFPGVSGFSAANLWRMKPFYETYVDKE